MAAESYDHFYVKQAGLFLGKAKGVVTDRVKGLADAKRGDATLLEGTIPEPDG